MQATLYAGLRNPARDMEIFQAVAGKTIAEVAADFELAPSTVRAACKRIEDLAVFDLKLTGGVSSLLLALLQPSLSGALPWLPTATSAAPSATWSSTHGRLRMVNRPSPSPNCATSIAATHRSLLTTSHDQSLLVRLPALRQALPHGRQQMRPRRSADPRPWHLAPLLGGVNQAPCSKRAERGIKTRSNKRPP